MWILKLQEVILKSVDCGSYDNESEIMKSVDHVSVSTQVITASIIHDPINEDYGRAMSKPRTALFQERENDEPMTPRVNISGVLSSNNMKDPSFINFGAFSFDIRQNMTKEEDLPCRAIMSTKLIFYGVNLRKQHEKQFMQIGSILCEIKEIPT